MNLQEKLSGLKGLVTHSHSKRRYKGDLTLDMISPPLGDFRHTMHVGRGGDVFGDTTFLSNHGGTANGNSADTDSISSPDNKIGAFFSRTLRQIRRGSDLRPSPGPKDLSPPPPAISPIIKNAVSLPRLDVDMPNGNPTAKVLFPSTKSTPEERKSSYGLDSGFVTLPRLSRSERQQPSISLPSPCSSGVHRGSLTDPTDAILSTYSAPLASSNPMPASTKAFSDSLPSLTSLGTFTFDLGPSLMSEVFGLIDRDHPLHHQEENGGQHYENSHTWEREEVGSACGTTNEGSEMDSATISYVDSLLREDCGGLGGKRTHSGEWENEEELMNENRGGITVKAPDVLMMGSPQRARIGMGMETERFQSATDVLARHYGAGLLKGLSGKMEQGEGSEVMMIMAPPKKNISYNYMDDEDEIKV